MNDNLIEQLLNENESTSLDFKQAQYPFDGESDDIKSELLKDILAFANSWRRTDAYILIGVQEVKGGRSNVLGISKHLADNSLQQFVNSKTSKPVTFSYSSLQFEGKQLGVIQIHLQNRPVYLTKDYGKLKKNIVYIRRGSSTDEASPDEIAKMGMATAEEAKQLSLELQFADIELREFLGNSLELKTTLLKLPTGTKIPSFSPAFGNGYYPGLQSPNNEYFKELFNYYQVKSIALPVGFAIKNTGQSTAQNVCLEIAFEPKNHLLVFETTEFPDRPLLFIDHTSSLSRVQPALVSLNSNVNLNKYGQKQILNIDFGNIQPKATSWADRVIYLASQENKDIILSTKIYADNLASPIEFSPKIIFDVKTKEVSFDELEEWITKESGDEDGE